MKVGHYPVVVNENVARIVASTVVFLGAFTIIFPNPFSLIILLFGFSARLSYGPRYEPFALITSRWIVPKFNISFIATPGPPKRFAQLIGFLFALTSLILFSSDQVLAYKLTLGILVFFASLESFLGWCAGCFFFGLLMKAGVIPKDICDKCNNINLIKSPSGD